MRAIKKFEVSLDEKNISDIIGRDSKEYLKLKKPQFDESKEHRIDFWNKNIKWHFSIIQYFKR